MALICGIHCLVTPVLLVALPVLATTFWVDANFHLWMLLFVIPTTTFAVFSGCRRHKDKWVIGTAALGLSLLAIALAKERMAMASAARLNQAQVEVASTSEANLGTGSGFFGCITCGTCAPRPAQGEGTDLNTKSQAGLPWHLMLNTMGGLFLVAAHTRNFVLCRREECRHG
jgi:hypothetical protein